MNKKIVWVYALLVLVLSTVGYGIAFGYGGGAISSRAVPIVANQVITTTTTVPTATVTAPAYLFNFSLNTGSRGNAVKALQERLKAEGLYFGLISGIYNKDTTQAVKIYQRLHKISPVGTVGPITRTALNSGVNAPATASASEQIKALTELVQTLMAMLRASR
jgi:peptidoglycan hydrolase-like protein with peptidoglycan-binding domain